MTESAKASNLSWKLNLSFSKATACPSCWRYPSNFSARKLLLTAKQSALFVMESWWVKLSRIWILVCFIFGFNLGFPLRNCEDFAGKSLSEQSCFCTRFFNILFSYPSLDYLITLKRQKLSILLLCSRTNLFESYWLYFFHQEKFLNLIVLKRETLIFVAPSRTVISREIQNLPLNVLLLAIPTLLSKSTNWTSPTKVSVDNFNRVLGYSMNMFSSFSPVFVFLLLNLAKLRLVVAFL